jgi:hypothetical protein
MRVFIVFILLLTLPSCATKKYTKARLLPDGIKKATEEVYTGEGPEKKLLHTKQMVFTKNGRIKYSKTIDAAGNTLQETQKKLWFIVESYPDKEPYYCKTRWQPKQRERISCYSRKKYKRNEAIYHYNTDGSIAKIADNFTPFYTQYFYYANQELSKIVIKDKNDQLIDEVLISCVSKDEKGTCLKEIRISTKTNNKEEILFSPEYD